MTSFSKFFNEPNFWLSTRRSLDKFAHRQQIKVNKILRILLNFNHLLVPVGKIWISSVCVFIWDLVNKIRVFCALVNETAYSCGRFSLFVVWFLAYYYSLLKVFWRLAFLHRLWSYYCLSVLLSISYYTGIDNWSFPHAVCSCHPLKKHRLSTDNTGCWQ